VHPRAGCATGSTPLGTAILPDVDDTELLETTVDRRVVHRGGYLTVRVDTVEDANGRRHQRDVVEHPGAVAIVALDGPDVLLVRQYRTPVGRVCLEIPAGTLDRGPDGSTEDPEVAAPRELAEETGFRAGSWRFLGRFFTAAGFADEDMRLFLATDLTPIPGYAGPGTDERLHVVRIPWRNAVEMADSGILDDAKSLIGLFWVDRLVARGEVPLLVD
jgi:ADP-ribose pyrophosphatase